MRVFRAFSINFGKINTFSTKLKVLPVPGTNTSSTST